MHPHSFAIRLDQYELSLRQAQLEFAATAAGCSNAPLSAQEAIAASLWGIVERLDSAYAELDGLPPFDPAVGGSSRRICDLKGQYHKFAFHSHRQLDALRKAVKQWRAFERDYWVELNDLSILVKAMPDTFHSYLDVASAHVAPLDAAAQPNSVLQETAEQALITLHEMFVPVPGDLLRAKSSVVGRITSSVLKILAWIGLCDRSISCELLRERLSNIQQCLLDMQELPFGQSGMLSRIMGKKVEPQEALGMIQALQHDFQLAASAKVCPIRSVQVSVDPEMTQKIPVNWSYDEHLADDEYDEERRFVGKEEVRLVPAKPDEHSSIGNDTSPDIL